MTNATAQNGSKLVTLPYIRNTAEMTVRLLRQHNTTVVYKPANTLRRTLSKPKAKLDPMMKNNVTYMRHTGRKLSTRLHEHKLATKKTRSIFSHLRAHRSERTRLRLERRSHIGSSKNEESARNGSMVLHRRSYQQVYRNRPYLSTTKRKIIPEPRSPALHMQPDEELVKEAGDDSDRHINWFGGGAQSISQSTKLTSGRKDASPNNGENRVVQPANHSRESHTTKQRKSASQNGVCLMQVTSLSEQAVLLQFSFARNTTSHSKGQTSVRNNDSFCVASSLAARHWVQTAFMNAFNAHSSCFCFLDGLFESCILLETKLQASPCSQVARIIQPLPLGNVLQENPNNRCLTPHTFESAAKGSDPKQNPTSSQSHGMMRCDPYCFMNQKRGLYAQRTCESCQFFDRRFRSIGQICKYFRDYGRFYWIKGSSTSRADQYRAAEMQPGTSTIKIRTEWTNKTSEGSSVHRANMGSLTRVATRASNRKIDDIYYYIRCQTSGNHQNGLLRNQRNTDKLQVPSMIFTNARLLLGKVNDVAELLVQTEHQLTDVLRLQES
ncbi:hypothetical protein CLF_101576 [Clonorchis sinensis]|uniref:Uncharacterized protein n=1 Tax=Clonorchis sinensis TaxID=79923 RepID=G7Y626_CLOSI|nr:hypothetical protein CLF_101576 [Clonorchis sinensis]